MAVVNVMDAADVIESSDALEGTTAAVTVTDAEGAAVKTTEYCALPPSLRNTGSEGSVMEGESSSVTLSRTVADGGKNRAEPPE